MTNLGGRPTEYNEETISKAEEYLKQCKDVYLPIKGRNRRVISHKFKVNLPSIEGLSIYLNVTRPTIYDWKERYEGFSYILDRILAEQARRLLENGLSGDYNANIAKLALGKHGYKESSETDITSGGKPISEIIKSAREEK